MPQRTSQYRLIASLHNKLRAAADPAKAPFMQAYMKSTMPYLGISAVPLRTICKKIFAEHALATFDEWTSTILTLWRDATHREHRYAAIELAGHKLYRHFQVSRTLPIYQEMITTGAWWDYVDPIAIHRVGPLLRDFPSMRPKILQWAASDDLWLRRSAIISQIAFKADTDLDLLHACIEPAIGEREFFLRKAIGWALREYAKTDPRYVLRYVKQNRSRLSPLSKREALKASLRNGTIQSVP